MLKYLSILRRTKFFRQVRTPGVSIASSSTVQDYQNAVRDYQNAQRTMKLRELGKMVRVY
ncbi:MAG: hypothetical protein WAL24_09615 [Nitrososphaeraceae archaeon]